MMCLEQKQITHINTLEDTIQQRGAMDELLSNSVQVEITGHVKDILRAYVMVNGVARPISNIKTMLKGNTNTS